jgi:hypothetical protein
MWQQEVNWPAETLKKAELVLFTDGRLRNRLQVDWALFLMA